MNEPFTDQITRRLDDLRQELEAGRSMHQELEQKRQDLEQKMLRISGAIQVLEEILESGGGTAEGED